MPARWPSIATGWNILRAEGKGGAVEENQGRRKCTPHSLGQRTCLMPSHPCHGDALGEDALKLIFFLHGRKLHLTRILQGLTPPY